MTEHQQRAMQRVKARGADPQTLNAFHAAYEYLLRRDRHSFPRVYFMYGGRAFPCPGEYRRCCKELVPRTQRENYEAHCCTTKHVATLFEADFATVRRFAAKLDVGNTDDSFARLLRVASIAAGVDLAVSPVSEDEAMQGVVTACAKRLEITPQAENIRYEVEGPDGCTHTIVYKPKSRLWVPTLPPKAYSLSDPRDWLSAVGPHTKIIRHSVPKGVVYVTRD